MKKQKTESFVTKKDDIVNEIAEFNNISVAKLLDGFPKDFDKNKVICLHQLEKQGVAYKCEDGRWMRGHKWRGFVKSEV